mmetsp:Transcript_2791/g.4235  ORF Transcript_2791/g.4235 Transcript_2791/m.4235 type:complete len:267 (-) Transcript_2791:881-1681(-)
MGGHGGLNILPQKSWNVYNRDCREKVAKDERKHREEEEKKRKRSEQSEAEARVKFLKEKAKRQRLESSSDNLQSAEEVVVAAEEAVASSSSLPLKHVNLFEDIEAAAAAGGNLEHMAEKRAADEKADKEGVMFLGQSSVEKKQIKPWYLSKVDQQPKTDKQIWKEARRKQEQDPMASMTKYVSAKKTADKEKIPAQSSKGGKSVDDLRQERLAREKKEREKVIALFASCYDHGESITGEGDRYTGWNGGHLRQFQGRPKGRREWDR